MSKIPDNVALMGILSDDQNVVPYRRELNALTGGVIPTLLLQQFIFLWKQNKRRAFYKFIAPCEHRDYRVGDSWSEELGISDYQFRSAFKKLEALGMVSKKTDSMRVTYYTLNEAVTFKLIKELYEKNAEEEQKEAEFPHFEEEFGKDKESATPYRPSKNQVKMEAKKIALEKGVDKQFLIDMAEDFWLGKEGTTWGRLSRWEPLLEVYLNRCIRNGEERKFDKQQKRKKKEPKVTTPSNTHEMSLWLKQLSDDQRAKILFKDNEGNPIVINHIGLPVFKEGGEYCSQEYTERVMSHFLSDFNNIKKTYAW